VKVGARAKFFVDSGASRALGLGCAAPAAQPSTETKIMRKPSLIPVAALLGLLALAACHTVQGAGQDIKASGQAIDNAAQKATP
jgi:predicted small secreted protein